MFRKLLSKEEVEFREWARKNYVPFSELNPLWHPVVIDECCKINEQAMDPQRFMLNIVERFNPTINDTKEEQ